jgi:acyl-CoA reductase-like NAD-dependent aldehyde dehydrogenase
VAPATPDFELALEIVNASRYGLQAGLYTNRLDHALMAFERLDVGAVILNDVPTWRIDPMPYGGTKWSGTGREGVRYTMHELSERRLLVLNEQIHAN